MIPEIVPFDQSLQFLGGATLLWIGQKAIDTAASRVLNRKFFQPVIDKIFRQFKIFKTRADPVAATFSLSFTPRSEISVNDAVEGVSQVFQKVENTSNNKISVKSEHWDKGNRTGTISVSYSGQKSTFDIDVGLTPDTTSLVENPEEDPDQLKIGSIGMDIEFTFPFKSLEDTLFNLSSFIGQLDDGFDSEMNVSTSGGRFVISPVNTNLTIDEWVENEQFDISLLLSPEVESEPDIEFFSDRAVIKSMHREIDAQTVKYVRELLLNYYL